MAYKRARLYTRIARLLVAGTLGFAIISCSGMLGGFDATPDGVYKGFWADFSRLYAYEKEITESSELTGRLSDASFDALKKYYDSRSRKSFQDLAETLIHIVNDLRDPHLKILIERGGFPATQVQPHNYSILNGKSIDNFEELWKKQGAIPLEPSGGYALDAFDNFVFGIVPKSAFNVATHDSEIIGYIGIKDLVLELSGASRLSGSKAWIEKIETIIASFNKEGVSHLILDIRSDAGGSLFNAKYIAARFAKARKHAIIVEERRRDSTFHRRNVYSEPEGKLRFTKPVAILVNKRTCSGGELLALFLYADEQAKIIGSNSRGCTGAIIERDLPNGWVFRITSSRTFRADGTSYFRDGIAPDIEVSQTSSDTDDVLKAAVEQLTNPGSDFYTPK